MARAAVKPAVPRAAGASPWGDLRLRIASASVLAPVAMACIWFGGWPFAALVALMAAGLAFEWLSLCGSQRSAAAVLTFSSLPIAAVLTAFDLTPVALAVLSLAAVTAIMAADGISRQKPLAFGIPYLGLAPVVLVWLRQAPDGGRAVVIVLLLLVWASDIGAYVAGRAIGGPKLAPAISPGKTWSGAAGGLAAALAVGFLAAEILGHGGIPWRAMGLAGIAGCVSQIGDLFESRLKRDFGVKDSGWLIPGHGGLLDRLDAVLFVVPFGGLLALILGRGVVIWQ